MARLMQALLAVLLLAITGVSGALAQANCQPTLTQPCAKPQARPTDQSSQRPAAKADEEPIDFRGEFLHAFLATERVRSHLPVTVTRGATEIHADAMEYDNLERVVQLKGRVQATFPAARGRK